MPQESDIAVGHSGAELPRPNYLQVLGQLHSVLSPRTYLEIGTNTGSSLRLAHCASLAIDPQFCLESDAIGAKPSCQFFQLPSDRFFADFDPLTLLGRPIDLAFLYGMHLFEYLLRDFANVEAVCRKNSVIAIHDAVPTDLAMAERVPVLGAAWTGDVWKAVLILKRYRPDLSILCLDAPPTGLILITNLNPQSRLIQERYFSLVDEFRDLPLASIGLDKYLDDISIHSSAVLSTPEAVAARFWL